jgi:tetratricopeptide (TPR) repeat protein
MPRLSISQIELLELHLLEMEPFRSDMEVPCEACQEGISERMESGVHNISRALATMTAEGLVESRLCHVRGAPKRRKAYFLTEKGLHSALSLVKDLEGRIVSFDDGRSIRNLTLAVAIRCFEDRTGKRPGLFDLVNEARDCDTLVLGRLSKTSRKVEVMYLGRPEVEVFEGREKELKQLDDFIGSKDLSCALVLGLPGIGKSTLASMVFESSMKERSAFWYTIHEWDSPRSVMSALNGFLHNGSHDVHPDGDLESDIAKVYSPTVVCLRDIGPIVFFDDVDRASPNVSLLLSLLCDAVNASPPSKIVLISRSVPSFLSSTPGGMRIELKCIDEKASSSLASRWHAQDPTRAAAESGGHPLMLRLSCELGTEAARGSMDELLGEHFRRVLDQKEKEMLEFLSVIRLPILAKELPGFLPETVASLKRKGLVQEYAEGVSVHQVVRSYFISRTPHDDVLRMHRIAAEYCRGHTGEGWRLEEMAQDIASEDWGKVSETLLENVEGLMNGYAGESMTLLSEIPPERLAPTAGARLSLLLGRLNQMQGRPRDALTHFERSLSLIGDEQGGGQRAEVMEAYARSLAEVNRIEDSLRSHGQALSYYEGRNDMVGMIREWMGIGSTWRRAHGVREAVEAFDKAMRIARELGDVAAVAANLNNLALLRWESGDLKGAEEYLRESISVARTAGDEVGEAIGQTNLADLFYVQLREKESENLRLESAETFRRAGDIIQSKKIKARWARDVSRKGRGGEAIGVIEKLIGVDGRSIRTAPDRASGIDEGDLHLLNALIEVHRAFADRERADRAVETLFHVAHDSERKDLEAQAWMEVALMDESFGDLVPALGKLKRAEGALRELGNSEGLGAVYLRSGMIRLQMGERNEALVDLREAVRHAERSGNPMAHSAALEELGQALGSISPEGRECLERSRQLGKGGRMGMADRG